MPRLKKDTDVKKKEVKFYLTDETKSKLSALCMKTKMNQSQLIESFINEFDEEQNLYKSVNYIKSREVVFSDLAKFIFQLQETQNRMENAIDGFENQLRDYKNKTVETQNSLVEKIVEKEKILEDERNKDLVDVVKNKIKNKFGM